ncbi:MAG: N-6 DNA methylase [candidate division Zixibacteria bacterium]|nr:N-6 DNA methylase [Candidatus Tariuqbacter arcticus]
MISFTEAKAQFDAGPGKANEIAASIVPVDGKQQKNILIRNAKHEPLEEYYKWQFIYALINSSLYIKDYIGVEIRFPKGSKGAAPLKLDGAIFDDVEWLQHYRDYWLHGRSQDLEWLNAHLLAVIEFKRDDKEIDKVFTGQVKPAMKEKDPGDAYVLGMYYNRERLYLFHRRDGLFLRYDEAKNQKGKDSKVGDLSLHLPDPYSYIPSSEDLRKRVHRSNQIDRGHRNYDDLDIIPSITTVQLQTALSDVLRTLDNTGLVNQRGYQVLIEAFALKIFDEKRNERYHKKLEFYITHTEANFKSISEKPIQDFIKRMNDIRRDATGQYKKILSTDAIDWKDQNHVSAVVAVCKAFQDFSFVSSAKSDLYQLVFYNFANQFQQQEKAQFLTPLEVIKFLVRIVNPRNNDTVIDPCCGIGDFLSLAFVMAQDKDVQCRLDDANIYGVDLDENMIRLAMLNMLLNGDGAAKLVHKVDKGSILSKFIEGNPPNLRDLIPGRHKNGNWQDWPDKTKLMQFDVVLTNPPFGGDRAYRPKTANEREIIEMYETWNLSSVGDNIDLGVVFLENAYQILKPEGRLGIVLSNSIASINHWRQVREWLMERMRIVALFDLPANVFAETGVNTTLIIAYKPKDSATLKKLVESDYSVFVRDIQNVGYEKRTSKRNVFFNPVYRMDETTFEVMTDAEGQPILDEDFTQTIADFRQWTLGQEETLQRLFCKEA